MDSYLKPRKVKKLNRQRTNCKICNEVLPNGYMTHYWEAHKIALLEFESRQGTFTHPVEEDTNEVDHWVCPVCQKCSRAKVPDLRTHLKNKCLNGIAAENCLLCDGAEETACLWVHQQLKHTDTVEVDYLHSVGKMALTRDSAGGDFVCGAPGCSYHSPFPGSMVFHAYGCRTAVRPSESNGDGVPAAAPQSTSHLAEKKRKAPDSDSSYEPSPKRKEKNTHVQSARSDRTGVSDAPGPSASARQPTATEPGASTSQDPLFLHQEPGFPSSDVHAFVADLSLDNPHKFRLFERLGKAGIREKGDLDLLDAYPEKARDYLLDRGVSFLQVIAIRQGLYARAPDMNRNAKADSQMLKFLQKRTPSLEHLSPILRSIGLNYSDLKHVSSQPEVWPAIGRCLLSKGVKYSDYVAFKRAITPYKQDDIDPTDTSRNKALRAFLGRIKCDLTSKINAFVHVGLRHRDDLDMVCGLTEEQMDEVLDGLAKEGLGWLECKAVQEALKQRAQLKAGQKTA
ncbi:hypothetical protein EIP91_012118 [Steccherinum ochraceum]|uniref:Uncharacterized protein n=1 Tax=Steccherinum ochraceum TaxID=92696 RepID=A0A4R0RQJ9_9APHY|nr:hypothetical protein EIP91_012118 [Steccherinum ochraceum]